MDIDLGTKYIPSQLNLLKVCLSSISLTVGLERNEQTRRFKVRVEFYGYNVLILAETVHLFAHNPLCHTIFFAAVTDNGFARLLEQYVCDPIVKNKIILVHPGYMEWEISRLNYTSVEWPLIFQHRNPSPVLTQKLGKLSEWAERDLRYGKAIGALAVVEQLSGLGPAVDLRSVNIGLRKQIW